MIVRIRIVLSEDEVREIQELAEKELRPLKEQIRFLLRQELQRRRLLPEAEMPILTVTPQEKA